MSSAPPEPKQLGVKVPLSSPPPEEPADVFQWVGKIDSARALVLFTGALAVGATSIYTEVAHPLGSVLPVVAYGMFLLMAQRRYMVYLNPTLKDSPYFLGFILTMIGLASIFSSMGGLGAADFDVAPIVAGAGAAILATVAGLFMRQVLMSLDPGEAVRDKVFESMAQKFREQSELLVRAQSSFAQMVTDFQSSHADMLSKERVASEQYLAQLQASSGHLSHLVTELPAAIRGVLEVTRALSEQIDASRNDLGSALAGWPEQLRKEFSQEVRAFATEAQSARTAVGNATRSLDSEVQALVVNTGDAALAIQARKTDIENLVNDYTTRFRGMLLSLESLASAAKTSVAGVEQMGRDATEAGTTLKAAAGDAGKAMHTGIRQHLDEIGKDVKAIDDVVSDLSRLLQQRMVGGVAPNGTRPK